MKIKLFDLANAVFATVWMLGLLLILICGAATTGSVAIFISSVVISVVIMALLVGDFIYEYKHDLYAEED